MNLIPLFVTFGVSFCMTWAMAHADPELSDATKLRLLDHETRLKQIAQMSSERRRTLAEQVKAEERATTSPQTFLSTLLHLGDEETLQQQADIVIHGHPSLASNAVGLLLTYPDARVVAAIGPALARDPIKEEYDGNNMFDGELGMGIKDAVCRLLIAAPGFTGEVKAWAREMASALGYFSKPLVEEWWKANREHFEKGEYLLVQPGGRMPPEGSYEAYEARPGRWKMRLKPEAAGWTPAPPPPVPSTTLPAIPTPTPSIRSIQPDNPAPSRKVSYVLTAALLVLVAAGAVIYAARRK